MNALAWFYGQSFHATRDACKACGHVLLSTFCENPGCPLAKVAETPICEDRATTNDEGDVAICELAPDHEGRHKDGSISWSTGDDSEMERWR